MKVFFEKSITASVLALTVFLAAFGWHGIAQAQLTGALQGMYANVTEPAVVKSNYRNGVAFGSAYIRSPIETMNLMTFDPPRLSTGCGGIDLYLGSFSFISADQLTAFLRAIAQNAAPLAFQMALEAAFPQLGSVLSKFQDIAQKMNNFSMNSCQVAQGIMTDGGSAMLEEIKAKGEQLSASVGSLADDFADARNKSTSKPSLALKNSIQEKDLSAGNITWNALRERSKNNASVYNWIGGTEAQSKGLIMAMLGSTITQPAEQETGEMALPVLSAGMTRLKDLARPPVAKSAKQSVVYWSCPETIDCIYPEKREMETTGIEGHINDMLYGAGKTTPSGTTADSILGRLMSCKTTDCSFSPEQGRFLTAFGNVPFIQLVIRAQRMPNVMFAITPRLAAHMVDEATISYGEGILRIAKETYSGTDIPKPDQYDKGIQYLEEDLREAKERRKKNMEEFEAIAKQIDMGKRLLAQQNKMPS